MHRTKMSRFTPFPFAAMWLLACCSAAPQDEPKQVVRIVTGRVGGAHHQLGLALTRFYNDSELGIDASIRSTPPQSVMLSALEEESADLVIARADIAYAAYQRGTQLAPRPHTNLRGIAVTFSSTLHIVVGKASAIETLSDLRSKRVGYTAPPAEMTPTVRLLDLVSSSGAFDPYGLQSVGMNLDEMIAALAAGTLDGGFMLGSDPAPVLSQLEQVSGFRLLEVPPMRRREFVRSTALQTGACAGRHVSGPGPRRQDNRRRQPALCRAELEEDLRLRADQGTVRGATGDGAEFQGRGGRRSGAVVRDTDSSSCRRRPLLSGTRVVEVNGR